MSFYPSNLNFIVTLMVLALLNACTSKTHYAPVITYNKEFAVDKQNLSNSKQGLNKGNPVVTRDMRKYPVVKNRRTFHTMGLSSGYQRLPPWHQKTLTRDIMAEKK